MTEKRRLVDANLIDKRLAADLESGDEKFHISWFRSWIGTQETVDAEEVVRCKDCARYKKGYCTIRKDSWGAALLVGEHDFCSYGERKEK